MEKETAVIEVHPLTSDPTAAWDELRKFRRIFQLDNDVSPGKISPNNNEVRVVCTSDTHSKTSSLNFEIPDGDILIHAGDFTDNGLEDEMIKFNDWLGKLPHTHKIVIAGNHERSLDPRVVSESTRETMRNRLTNCIYLEDSFVTLYGLKIYGSPWQPRFDNRSAFKLTRGRECLEKWNLVPEDADVLVTHAPPLGCNDLCRDGLRAGCAELLTSVQRRIKPFYHIFGHIHEGYGLCTDGETIFINASMCNQNYEPVNKPIVVDIPSKQFARNL